MEKLIGGLYFEKAIIGQGAFGQIYLGQNTQTKQMVAIKKEMATCKNPQLAYESKVYKCLEGGMGIPKVYYQATSAGANVMVMDLLGPSLEDMFNYCYRRFSVKTVLMLGIELLTRLEFIHHRHIIHRDIKPDNFVLGLGERANVIYVIDFGLSKRYRTPGTKEHIPYREGKSLTGTPRYASINNHKGVEQSRRDDLESLGYILIYFLKGRLPWQGLQGDDRKMKYELIRKTKEETSLDDLCAGLPVQIKDYMQYCRSLAFDQIPDYRYLRRLLKTALEERKLKNDGVYDWVNSPEKFADNRLPKHCLNSSSLMIDDLRHPAPSEFREMYKEEAYRQKSMASTQDMRTRLPQTASSIRSSVVTSYPPSSSSSSHRPAYSSIATLHSSTTRVSTTPISSTYMSTARLPPPSLPQSSSAVATAATSTSTSTAATSTVTRPPSLHLHATSTAPMVPAPPTAHLPIHSSTHISPVGTRLSGVSSSNHYGVSSISSGSHLPPPPPPPPTLNRGLNGTRYSALQPPSAMTSSSRPLPPALQKGSTYERNTSYSYSSQRIGAPSYNRYQTPTSSNPGGHAYGQGDRQGISTSGYGGSLKYNGLSRYPSTTAEQTNENSRLPGYRN